MGCPNKDLRPYGSRRLRHRRLSPRSPASRPVDGGGDGTYRRVLGNGIRVLDGPSAVFIGNQHSLLAAVCAFDPAYNTALVQKQPPLDAVPDPTTPTTSQEADPLLALLPMSVGAEGDAVQSIQRLLIIAGESLYPDGADSRFGPGTEARVATFQTRNGLPASGVVDEQTLLLLRGHRTVVGIGESCPRRSHLPDDRPSSNDGSRHRRSHKLVQSPLFTLLRAMGDGAGISSRATISRP